MDDVTLKIDGELPEGVSIDGARLVVERGGTFLIRLGEADVDNTEVARGEFFLPR